MIDRPETSEHPHEGPTVSVVIPAYNAADTLPATLASALAQAHREMELLVVDDGSTDDTAAVIDRVAAIDSRVRRIEFGGNVGRSMARNGAIDLAKGEWVAFLDADDLWPVDRLERLLAAATRFPQTSVVFDDRIGFEVTAEGVRLDDRFVSRSTWRLDDGALVDRRGWLADKFCHMDPMIRRSFLAGGGPRYPHDLSAAEDLCFCMQVAYWPTPSHPVRVGRPGYYYRMAPTTRAAGGVWSLRRAVDIAVEETRSAELRDVTDQYWPGLAWRFSVADRQFAAAGRLGPPDPSIDMTGDLGDSLIPGIVSTIREKGLHGLAKVVDRRLRPDITADIALQLAASPFA